MIPRTPDPVLVKNVTVTVDDETYHRARVRAAELRTSLSALVRKSLQELAAGETGFERLKRLERETVAKLRARGGRFSARERLTRDEVHDRNALR